MMYLLVAISFLGSVAVTVFLRRRDRRAVQPGQFRRVSELQAEQVKKVASDYLQQIKDATLEFELMVRKSRQSQTELSNELGIVQEKLETLKTDRELIENISRELSDIASSAAGVSAQVERLDDGLARLGFASQEMAEIGNAVKNLRGEMAERGKDAEQELKGAIVRLVAEAEERTSTVVRQAEQEFARLRDQKAQLEENIEEHGEQVRVMGVQIDQLGERVDDRIRVEADRYTEKFVIQERNFQERFAGLESGLTAIRTTALEAVQRDTQRIRSELDNFNLEAISKRDEILNETRRMAEGIGDKIELFQEKYIEADNRLRKQVEEQKRLLTENREEFEQQWSELEARQSGELQERIASLQAELEEARRTRLEGLEGEAIKLVSQVDARVREGEELIRKHAREEEHRLQQTRQELGDLRDGMTMLGHELKAGMRAEAEHGLTLLRESRHSEEEALQRAREELDESRKQLEEQLEEIDESKHSFLARLEKETQARRDEYTDQLKEVERIFEQSRERQATTEQKLSTELQETAKELLVEVSEKLRAWGRSEEDRHRSVQEAQTKLLAEMDRQSQRLAGEHQEVLERLEKEGETIRLELQRSEKEALANMEKRTANFQEEGERALEKVRREADDARELLGEFQGTLLEGLRTQGRALEQGQAEFRKEMEALAAGAEGEMERSRDDALELLEKRAGRFLSEQDEKLGRINETIDEKISRQIANLTDKGRIKIEELEKRTVSVVQETVRRMEEELDMVRDQFRRVREDMASETEQAEQLRNETLEALDREKDRLEKFGHELRKVERAEELIVKLDETLEVLTDRLSLASDENRRMDDVVRNLETMRASRKELESELRLLESQRGRLAEAEKHFQTLEAKLAGVEDRFLDLNRAQSEADNLEERLASLQESKAALDKFFDDLGERKKFLENAVRYIEGARQQAIKAGESADTLLDQVSRAELRQEDLNKNLQALEARSQGFGKMEREIQKVESRFEQMDGLLGDLDIKQKQIAAMARRSDEMKEGADALRHELESIVSEADEKMERLSSFFQLIDQFVDRQGELLPAEGGRSKSGSALSDVKRNGILSLYLNHKWEPDLIAQRMRLEPAVVKAVIAGHQK